MQPTRLSLERKKRGQEKIVKVIQNVRQTFISTYFGCKYMHEIENCLYHYWMPSDFKFVRGKEGNEAADTSEANFNNNYEFRW